MKEEDISKKTIIDEEITDFENITEDVELTDEELINSVDTTEIESELGKTTWKEEAEQIPIEVLDSMEQLVVLKCINEEQLTEEETGTLQRVLAQYRPAIQKIKPKEQIDTLEDNIQIIEDEKAFLEIIQDYDEIETIPFTCYVGQQEVRMKFDLYPITDSQSILDITENLSMFKDFTDNELIVYNKARSGENLTREEMIIKAELDKKIEKLTRENEKELVIEFLASQLKFHGQDSNMEDMKRVFERINTSYLYILFNEVQKRSHMSDINVERVFQTFD